MPVAAWCACTKTLAMHQSMRAVSLYIYAHTPQASWTTGCDRHPGADTHHRHARQLTVKIQHLPTSESKACHQCDAAAQSLNTQGKTPLNSHALVAPCADIQPFNSETATGCHTFNRRLVKTPRIFETLGWQCARWLCLDGALEGRKGPRKPVFTLFSPLSSTIHLRNVYKTSTNYR